MTAGEDQPEPIVVNGAGRLGRVVVVQHLSLPLLVVALVLAPDPVDGLAVGGGGQPGAGVGGTLSAGHRSTAVANASAAASSAMSRSPNRLVRAATTRAHSSSWAVVIASRTSTKLQERPHLDLPIAGLRALGGELERRVEVRGLEDPEPGEVLLRLQERPAANTASPFRLSMTVAVLGDPRPPRRPSGPQPEAGR